ncbi:alanine dehydrogenase, partial [Staphylococcus pseudintermedius]
GGTVEGIRAPTISDPSYVEDDVIHSAVPNQPWAVPRKSTMVLAAGSIVFLSEISDKSIERAIQDNPVLAPGVTIYQGHI